MFKKIVFLLLCMVSLSAAPRLITTGTYINNVYHIDLFSESFNADLWIWFIYEGEDMDLLHRTVIVNAPYAKVHTVYSQRLPDGKMWLAMNVRGVFHQNINYASFPFMDQDLQIQIEPFRYYADELRYVPDNQDSKVSPRVDLDHWDFHGLHLSEEVRHYHTSYGNPSITGGVDFSRLTIELDINRRNVRTFINHFGIYYLAIILAVATFFVPMKELSSRLGLMVAAVFAAIGDNLFIDQEIPPVGVLTLIDKEQIVVLAAIMLVIITTLITRQFYRYEKLILQRRIDRIVGVIILILFVIFNYVILN